MGVIIGCIKASRPLELVSVSLYGEDLADVIELRVSKWRVYSGISDWAPNGSTSVVRGRPREISDRRGEARDHEGRDCGDATTSQGMP